MEVTQAAFARMAGVSRASINGKIKNKTLILNSAGMLDTDNPLNREYLNAHQQKNTRQTIAPAPLSFFGETETHNAAQKINGEKNAPQHKYLYTDSAAATAAGVPEYMLGLTIRELMAQYGAIQTVEKYVKILRDLTSADEKDQRMRERRQTLIPKDFVTAHVFELLEQMMSKLLDMPERIADNLIALVLTDKKDSRQKIINAMRDNVSVVITDTKELVIKQLELLKSKYTSTTSDATADAVQDLKEQIDELTKGGDA